MPRCHACSAPLPTHSAHCRYCGVRNDLDLHAHQVDALADDGSTLKCPECEIALDRVSVSIGEGLELAHCSGCYGMFFAPGGIEYALREGVSHADRVKIQQIDQINIDRFSRVSIRYRNCPVCELPMRRFNFAKRSGVIVDQCANHGIWLDNGELIHLLEWRKSGGHLLDDGAQQRNNDPVRSMELYEAQARADKTLTHYQSRRKSILSMEIDDIVYAAVDALTGFLK